MLIGQGMKLARDTRFRPRHMAFLVAKYRAQGIREKYKRNGEIEPQWLSDLGVVTVTPVNSADDPSVTNTSVTFGKITLPSLVSLPFDKGIYRVSSASNQSLYNFIDFNRLMAIRADSTTGKFPYCARVGVAAYLKPCTTLARAIVILSDPMDGFVLATENVAQNALVIGQSYTVYGTQIVSNSVAYNQGAVFTATAKTWTGNGTVKYTNQKRKMTWDDPYPMGLDMASWITEMIYTKEFQVEKLQDADIIDDGSDLKTTIQNADAIRRARESKESPTVG